MYGLYADGKLVAISNDRPYIRRLYLMLIEAADNMRLSVVYLLLDEQGREVR